MDITGKYGTAKVMTDNIDSESINQIYTLMNHETAENSKIVIMPDVHKGAGCVIGYTATLTDKLIPNLIGVDIGCGVICAKIKGLKDFTTEDKIKLDAFIAENIPVGKNVRKEPIRLSSITIDEIKEVCDMTRQDLGYALKSIGTLGGGNHFIEVDKDEDDNFYLLIHSGSRNFGKKIAEHFQSVAETKTLCMPEEEWNEKIKEIKRTKSGKSIQVAIEKLRKESKVRKHKRNGLEYLIRNSFEYNDYARSMLIAQDYASTSRWVMAKDIMEKFFNIPFVSCNIFESVHNYIDFSDKIIRKGAIRAHEGERLIIPLNMSDGCIIGTGKENPDWNYSAPHGAGRILSRSKAKETLTVEEYETVMKDKGVYSSCICYGTLDESPMAYKPADEIIKAVESTVNIDAVIKPVYNYKAKDEGRKW